MYDKDVLPEMPVHSLRSDAATKIVSMNCKPRDEGHCRSGPLANTGILPSVHLPIGRYLFTLDIEHCAVDWLLLRSQSSR